MDRFSQPMPWEKEEKVILHDWQGEPIYEGENYYDFDGDYIREGEAEEYMKEMVGKVTAE